MITPNIRGYDVHGAGHFGASRGKGSHHGVDFVCLPDSDIHALTGGIVTRIGYPYHPNGVKGHYRYVEIIDKFGLMCRYMYLSPLVQVGHRVRSGFIIGLSQSLLKTYPGITQHFHFEVKTKKGRYINPHCYFEMV